MSFDTFVHLFAGGLGGTFGAVVTCPLEVVKTRLQSSVANFNEKSYKQLLTNENVIVSDIASSKGLTIWGCIRHIIETEGPRALFKGLGPNLIGVAPSRAIYFCTYSQIKSFCNQKLTPDTPYVHMIAAFCAGFVSSTMTNPIWFIKTRMQLDQSQFGPSALECIKSIYKENGIVGFYKGITASYFGISETIIHFVTYEFIKSKLIELQAKRTVDEPLGQWEQKLNFVQYMAAAAISKSFASIIAYPHEVARTRLREEGEKYKRFFQTILLVYREDGIRNGLYRGLATQLIRQIPNTAIMMGTYEVVVYFMKSLSTPSSLHNETSPPQQCSKC